MSLCKDCITGVRHEGTAEGKFEDVDGVDCYVATPSIDYPKDKVLILLTDAFGLLINNQLIADSFAASGIKTIVPNLFRDPLAPEALNAKDFDFAPWLSRNGIDYSEPRARKVVAALKESGVTKIAVAGYCYGARLCFNLAFENEVSVVIVTHPSLLKTPEDLETYLAKSKAPLLINSCTYDSAFPLEAQEQADKIFGDGQFAPGYERKYWEGCTHGFAVRGDLSDPKVKAGKEGAFKASAEFLYKHLYGA
ncbi:dienelactone hydrolase endo-1,3,1,4-beta-D-glucanase [Cytidiella melzeri]|nr:dienelactone hydrolase endo-1,3,1,4-beta-D-glucanase [Cytidiella melzeri]